MEFNQQATMATTKTIYENFVEEKCETDLLIPDYFPAAEKIIQCNVHPVILRKKIEEDRLVLEGNCRFNVIYQTEDEEIKAIAETVEFSEKFPLKEAGEQVWIQTAVRTANASCRLLNPRKIGGRATIAIALKAKEQVEKQLIDSSESADIESLFEAKKVYTVLEHIEDTTKVQGEIEVHTDILEILKTEGSVSIKDIKVLPGKAMVKGILNLYILFVPEEDPCKIEQTSTAIPFTYVLSLEDANEDKQLSLDVGIQNIRADVEADDSDRNRLISITTTIVAEGELYCNKSANLLMDCYSNRYPVHMKMEPISYEELIAECEITESVRYRLSPESSEAKVIQLTGIPTIRKIGIQEENLCVEGVLDVSLFLQEEEQYRSVEKSFSFTLKKPIDGLRERMRCEVHPSLLSIECQTNAGEVEIKAELFCAVAIFAQETMEIVGEVTADLENPKEVEGEKALVVYYGEKGERLWDIARKYSTSVASIKNTNDFELDILRDKTLLLIAR